MKKPRSTPETLSPLAANAAFMRRSSVLTDHRNQSPGEPIVSAKLHDQALADEITACRLLRRSVEALLLQISRQPKPVSPERRQIA
jgi:hypothetical protein